MKPANPAPLAVARELNFANLQRARRLNARLLREITEAALVELGVAGWNLTFYFVGARKMAGLNLAHIQHEGPTDVITFDYSERATRNGHRGTRNAKNATRNTQHSLIGEIFICPDVAVTQAREFGTTWQSEVIRYIVHGILHLCGYDDLQPAARRRMKQVENRLVRRLEWQFRLAKICRP